MSRFASKSRYSLLELSFLQTLDDDPGRTPIDAQRMLMICDEAMCLPREERQGFLESACDGDEQLLSAALDIMQAIDDSGTFLRMPEP